jgi:hypothetical protein
MRMALFAFLAQLKSDFDKLANDVSGIDWPGAVLRLSRAHNAVRHPLSELSKF